MISLIAPGSVVFVQERQFTNFERGVMKDLDIVFRTLCNSPSIWQLTK